MKNDVETRASSVRKPVGIVARPGPRCGVAKRRAVVRVVA